MIAFLIGDDLTGTNVTNAILAKEGFKVGTLNNIDKISEYDDYDVIGVHTESRGIESEEAYQRVKKYTEKLKAHDFKFINHRIDSTMRGNIGSEMDAILDVLGEDYVAIVVPAFPDSDKIVIGNYMLIDDVPLEETDVSVDPTSPVTQSRINAILEEQTQHNIATISMQTVTLGAEAIQDTLEAVVENGARVIVIDAVTNEQITNITEAVVKADLPFISVDAGPFTTELVKRYNENNNGPKLKQKLMFLIGSASPIAIEQIQQFRVDFDPFIAKIDTRKVVDPDQGDAEKERVINAVLDNLEDNRIFLLATIFEKEDRLDLEELSEEFGLTKREVSAKIVDQVAEIGNKIMQAAKDEFSGMYTSGGDVTMSFLEKNETTGIRIEAEIEPLTVYGRIMGGLLDDKAIVTKGGLVGNKDTLSHVGSFITSQIEDFDEEKQDF